MGAGSTEQRIVPFGEGRPAIVAAAVRLVAREGLGKLTYRALSAEAGVSVGSVQHHFSRVQDVLEDALKLCVDTSLSYFVAPDSAENILENLLDSVREHPEVSAFMFEIFLEARRQPHLLEIADRFRDLFRVRVRESFAALSLEPDEPVVEALLATAEGMAYGYVMHGEAHTPTTLKQSEGVRLLMAAYTQILQVQPHRP
ncbi:TetR family transcriptional regulator [Streptomyces sp. NPDC006872]|uniref:TetR/AcrR family transcriptional regulator n=1 Tax=Streptomyces sp. NPDC006872 TaxID=3155720 RepID=UPI00340DA251